MVNAAVFFTTGSGYCVILEVQDGHVDVSVTEEITIGVGAFQLCNLAQSKNFFIKSGGLRRVLSGNGDVLNLGHLATPPVSLNLTIPQWGFVDAKIPRLL